MSINPAETDAVSAYDLPEPDWRHYAHCPSTNDLARAWALDGGAPAPHGAVVTADFQTAGRGRRGRSWSAQPGENLLFSLIARDVPVEWLGMACALAVADVVESFGLNTRLKWPNDVLLEAHKIAGILVESVVAGDGAVSILGIGINVNQQEFVVDRPSEYPPISLSSALGRDCDVRDVAVRLKSALLDHCARLQRESVAETAALFRGRLAVGAIVRRGGLEGRLQNITENGEAVVSLSDGTFVTWLTVD